MKEEILNIASHLREGFITTDEAKEQLLKLLGHNDGFISVSEQEPPHNVELLAKSPSGTIHLCSWRPAYNIFTCQTKLEKSWDWEWKLI